MNVYKREPYVDRLFLILDEAGFSPTEVLTITPEELIEVPGITVPNVRTILHLQQVVLNCTWVRDYRYDCKRRNPRKHWAKLGYIMRE